MVLVVSLRTLGLLEGFPERSPGTLENRPRRKIGVNSMPESTPVNEPDRLTVITS